MTEKHLNILVLDGGGSKGVYTIGVLKELELKLSKPLCESFDLIYGTSTGSIIAALIGLGYKIRILNYSLVVPPHCITSNYKQTTRKIKFSLAQFLLLMHHLNCHEQQSNAVLYTHKWPFQDFF